MTKRCSLQVGDRIESAGFPGTILTVSQVYLGDRDVWQIVFQHNGVDFCRASEPEILDGAVTGRIVKVRDDRYAHDHPRHGELMLPCYPACQGVQS
jgi:hypothetical protein